MCLSLKMRLSAYLFVFLFSINCIGLSNGQDIEGVTTCSVTSGRKARPLLDLGHKQYYVEETFKANWYQAAHYCRFLGMDLASINSEYENAALHSYRLATGARDENIWISGNDLVQEGKFYWLGTGQQMTKYTNWYPDEPSNSEGKENCVILRSTEGKWDDQDCKNAFNFACEVL